MKQSISIDEAIRTLTKAKEKIGGDKCLILSLTATALEDVNVNALIVADKHVEVRVIHKGLKNLLRSEAHGN